MSLHEAGPSDCGPDVCALVQPDLVRYRIVSISEPLSAVAREIRPYNVEVGRAESGLYVKQLRQG
jgi:hypothetical protein